MFGPLNFPSDSHQVQDVAGSKLVCVLCDNSFDPDHEREDYMNHMLENHNLVIKDYEEIIDLTGYSAYWKNRFKATTVKDVCGSNETKDDGSSCFILSNSLLEDKQLRERLLKASLDKALEKQKLEREDTKFSRKCLFCNHDIRPTRSEFLNHISTQHNLQLGKPDNLVYVDKFINLIEQKIESLKCIFCEKTFKDRNVLKEHMRKKQHKRVNPRNSIYDQFYVVNYLAPGKTNKKLRERKRKSDDDDDCDWSDWKEESVDSVVCLFCAEANSWQEIIQHLNDKHGFNFKEIIKGMNFYQQVKLVNYIRRQMYKNLCIVCNFKGSDRESLLTHLSTENHLAKPGQQLWDQPEYFFPTYENDGFLCHLDEGSNGNSDEEVDKSGLSRFIPSSGGEIILECLFCDKTNRSGEVILEHMSNIHQFHYYDFMEDFGFIDRVQLLNYLRNQISLTNCVNCNGHFETMAELVDHMIKENHSIAPPKQIWSRTEIMKSVGPGRGPLEVDSVDYIYALEGISDLQNATKVDSDVGSYSDFEDDGVPIVCLFCPTETTSWNQVMKHMAVAHEFVYANAVGSLTFYDQVKCVTFTREMVKESKCPVCLEKSDNLLDHLKTNNHFSLPKRELWDKSEYYPASFVGDPFLSELNVHHATDTLNLQQPDSNDSAIAVADSNQKDQDDGDNIDWSDWDEEMKISILCLFCDVSCDSWEDINKHLAAEHKFNYDKFSSGLSFYDQVKVINYIRKQVMNEKCINCAEQSTSKGELINHMSRENHMTLPNKDLWDRQEFFAPTLENDGFLTHLDDGSSDSD